MMSFPQLYLCYHLKTEHAPIDFFDKVWYNGDMGADHQHSYIRQRMGKPYQRLSGPYDGSILDS